MSVAESADTRDLLSDLEAACIAMVADGQNLRFQTPPATHVPGPHNDELPGDPVAETAKRIATLTPDELQSLREEIAAAASDDPYAEFDRAALACFGATTDSEHESMNRGYDHE